ncbi:MAG TPA: winged helix-turn-helix domain-containing protein, partial [Vineibacter sp.]|nr:winged helix-turn-helix domain-containing protein [Vineibacter sp.]
MIYRFGDCVLDHRQRALRRDGKPVTVEPQVFDLLRVLVEHRDRVVGRDELIDAVWGGRIVSDATVDSRVSAARRAIGDSGTAQSMIRTLPRRGFRFVATVLGEVPAAAAPAPAVPDLPSIAVLPFDNRTADARVALLADALAEDVTALLARVAGFFVVSARSAGVYRERAIDLRVVGRELGVRYVVTGSLRMAGERARVMVQLTDAISGLQCWSAPFDVARAALVDLQADVARAVVRVLEPELTRAELAVIRRRGSESADAWACFRQAVGTLTVGGWNEETIARTRAHLRQATDRDPGFGLAHAYGGLVAALGQVFGLLPDNDALRGEIRRMAMTALELDPDNPEVLGYVGCALADLGDYRAAFDVIERALEIDPSNAQAWMVRGVCLTYTDRLADGIADLRRGMRLSPLDRRLGMWGAMLANCLLHV